MHFSIIPLVMGLVLSASLAALGTSEEIGQMDGTGALGQDNDYVETVCPRSLNCAFRCWRPRHWDNPIHCFPAKPKLVAEVKSSRPPAPATTPATTPASAASDNMLHTILQGAALGLILIFALALFCYLKRIKRTIRRVRFAASASHHPISTTSDRRPFPSTSNAATNIGDSLFDLPTNFVSGNPNRHRYSSMAGTQIQTRQLGEEWKYQIPGRFYNIPLGASSPALISPV